MINLYVRKWGDYMTENIFVDYLKSYVDNGIDIPDYINDLSHRLNPIKIYEIGVDYLRKGLVEYAKPILKTVNISIE